MGCRPGSCGIHTVAAELELAGFDRAAGRAPCHPRVRAEAPRGLQGCPVGRPAAPLAGTACRCSNGSSRAAASVATDGPTTKCPAAEAGGMSAAAAARTRQSFGGSP